MLLGVCIYAHSLYNQEGYGRSAFMTLAKYNRYIILVLWSISWCDVCVKDYGICRCHFWMPKVCDAGGQWHRMLGSGWARNIQNALCYEFAVTFHNISSLQNFNSYIYNWVQGTVWLSAISLIFRTVQHMDVTSNLRVFSEGMY